jgi:quinoprotein glucose dehydrogenase
VVALGKQKSPAVAEFLNDSSERVALEAARIIWDAPVPAASDRLAAMIATTKSTSDPLLRRILAASVAGRTPHNLQSVVDFACRSDIAPTLRDLAWHLVRNWAAPSPRDSVNGDWRPLAPRSPAEVAAVLRKSFPRLVKLAPTNAAGLVIAAELGVDDAREHLLPIVKSESQPETIRVRAIAALGEASDALVQQAIDAGLKSSAVGVRTAARKLLAKRFPEQVVGRLSETMKSGTIAERQAAIDTLSSLSTPEAREALRDWMGRLENGDCPPELQIEVLEAAGKSADPALALRQKRFVDKLTKAGRLSQYSGCMSGGDPERGQKIFETNDTLACRRCHSTKPGEVLVGPSLASVGLQRKPVEILESIVAPNEKINEGFDTSVLELDSGKVVTGVIRREDDSTVELVDAEAKTMFIDKATIDNRLKGKSAMPVNLMEHMSQRDLRDIMAYMCELKSPIAAPTAAAAEDK